MAHSITFNVAGTTFEGRQGLLYYCRQRERSGASIKFMLARESDNAYDPLAVKVLAHVTQQGFDEKWIPIGYVPRTHNAAIAGALDAKRRVTNVRGGFHGGTRARKSIGCHITCTI